MDFREQFRALYERLRLEKKEQHGRRVSLGDLFTDRWENARFCGFGEGSSCYDNVLVIGDVTVGKNTWIGPNVILDGSGTLVIGDFCSISAGAQIYTHNTVQWSQTMGAAPAEKRPTRIGSGVYIGPQAVVEMGVTIGDRAVIGAFALVNADVPAGAKAWGAPARIQGA